MQALPIRLTPGQDLRRAIEAVVRAQNCRAAFVLSGIGSLSDAQVALVRKSLLDSPFVPERTLADRQARQAELLGLIRQLQAAQGGRTAGDGPAPRAAAQALQSWLQRGLPALNGSGNESAGWVRHGCQAFAALHNSTSAAQRQHAQQEIRRYEDDLRALAAQD